jgi:hypothetical protein
LGHPTQQMTTPVGCFAKRMAGAGTASQSGR